MMKISFDIASASPSYAWNKKLSTGASSGTVILSKTLDNPDNGLVFVYTMIGTNFMLFFGLNESTGALSTSIFKLNMAVHSISVLDLSFAFEPTANIMYLTSEFGVPEIYMFAYKITTNQFGQSYLISNSLYINDIKTFGGMLIYAGEASGNDFAVLKKSNLHVITQGMTDNNPSYADALSSTYSFSSTSSHLVSTSTAVSSSLLSTQPASNLASSSHIIGSIYSVVFTTSPSTFTAEIGYLSDVTLKVTVQAGKTTNVGYQAP
jgi:hypothetical protein